jgi:sulfur-oxidizing protein SoxY
VFHLGPQTGRAEIDTRVRLAGTQKVTVLAALSGNRFRMAQVEVLVTSAACLDEASMST